MSSETHLFHETRLDHLKKKNTCTERKTWQPVVIHERETVITCCHNARQYGIHTGMPLSVASVLCEKACFVHREPEKEQQTLNSLAYWAYHFTPTLFIKEPDSLLLEIEGSLILFNGIWQLWQKLSQGVTERGYHHCSGLGFSAKAAWLSSFIPETENILNKKPDRITPENLKNLLDQVPLKYWDITLPIQKKLTAAGFTLSREVLTLPYSALQKRYGKKFLLYIEELTGKRPESILHWTPPPRFKSSINFHSGISSSEQLLFPMRHLLAELCDFLQAQHLYCHAFQWHFYTFNRHRQTLEVRLTNAKNQYNDFLALTRLKMDQANTVRFFKREVESVALTCCQISDATPLNDDLFSQGQSSSENDMFSVQPKNTIRNTDPLQKNATQFLDKLQARLGSNSYYCISTANSHLPENAWKKTSVSSLPSHNDHSLKSQSIKRSLRPAWLLPRPQIIQHRHGKLFLHGAMQLLQGPERIDSHWWQQRHVRDYFITQHENGACYWVYHDRLNNQWYLHGIFS